MKSRKYLDKKIAKYENDIDNYKQELIILKNHLIKGFSRKINKALDLIDERTDRYSQTLINGTITTKDSVVDEILEKIKNLLNKKILVVVRQREELDELRKRFEKSELRNKELQERVENDESRIKQLEIENNKLSEKNTIIRKTKSELDLRLLDLQRKLQPYGIDVKPDKNSEGLIVGVSFSALRYDQNRAKENQDKSNKNKAIAQLKKNAMREEIILDVVSWGDNEYKVVWDTEGLKNNRENLNKKMQEQELLTQTMAKKYEKTKQEKKRLEKEIAELTKKSISREIEQKTISNEIDSIFEKLSKHEKDMDRAHLEKTMTNPHYADNFKTKKARNLAHKLNSLLTEKNILDREIAEYKQMIESYKQKLVELEALITRSLLMTYYDKTASVFELLTDEKYHFSPEARQLLAIYFCAAADKNSTESVRETIYAFVTEKPIKPRAHLANWLAAQVFLGAFNISYSANGNIANISIAEESKDYCLLPLEEWTFLTEAPSRLFSELVFNELLSQIAVVYKNNENNFLVHLLLEKLFSSFDRHLPSVNDSVRGLFKKLLIETNIEKKYELLSNWFYTVDLQNDFMVGKNLDTKDIFINFNPKTAAGFKMAVADNSKLFELFMNKYLLGYDYLLAYLPKQYLFYSDEFTRLLTIENNIYLNNKAKATFYEIFNTDKFVQTPHFFDKLKTPISEYMNYGYLGLSLMGLFFGAWPSLILQSTSWNIGVLKIVATIPLYLASLYGFFRITGKIKISWSERRENIFYKNIHKEFTAWLIRFKNSKEVVLEFQQRIPLLLLQEKEKYIVCLTGLLRYFMPRAQRNLISTKFMEENWDDLVCSLTYGSLQGAMGGLPLSVELLQKISELMNMLVVLDVMISGYNEPLKVLMNKIRQYYGLKGN